MRCPVCGGNMVEQDFGVTVDVCESGCKSIWFDAYELNQLDEKSEGFGAALDAALNTPQRADENRGQLQCPKCAIPMQKHPHRSSWSIVIDECVKCGGTLLDAGELAAIRAKDTKPASQKSSVNMEQVLVSTDGYNQAVVEEKKKKRRFEIMELVVKSVCRHHLQRW